MRLLPLGVTEEIKKGLRNVSQAFSMLVWEGNVFGLSLFREGIQHLLADLGQVVFVVNHIAPEQQIYEQHEDAPCKQYYHKGIHAFLLFVEYLDAKLAINIEKTQR